ncbi:gigaxonin-like [Impatiens glandulifera]|uniref:gigaxonin-like n=1 Tax=Impatiens glandulifera TaxID=253017 RepID=UPI001FB04C30|nr:gigaxonin-like [Impatiens glandulifera]
MGSVSSPTKQKQIYLSFCGRDPAARTNISNWIERYDPSTNYWDRITEIPGLLPNEIRKCFAMVSLADSIFIIGGLKCSKVILQEPDGIALLPLQVLTCVLRFNITTKTWTHCSPLSNARFDFACSVIDGKIFVAGGQSRIGFARGISSAEFYDPIKDEWKPMPAMNATRYKCAGVTLQGKFHVFGGFAQRVDGQTSSGPFTMDRSSGEVYNAEDETWTFESRMWELDVPPYQIVAIGLKLFSPGDCLKAWKGHFEVYDEKLRIWEAVDGSHLQPFSSPVTPYGDWPPIEHKYLTIAPIGTQLYLLTGYRTPGEIPRLTSAVHMFDTSEDGNGWTSFEPVCEEGEKEICCHCCVVDN